jgi:hypothetical protein
MSNENLYGKWAPIKDIIGFQFKLMVDGFRDFILVPVSIKQSGRIRSQRVIEQRSVPPD